VVDDVRLIDVVGAVGPVKDDAAVLGNFVIANKRCANVVRVASADPTRRCADNPRKDVCAAERALERENGYPHLLGQALDQQLEHDVLLEKYLKYLARATRNE
jgi:hypothetical protein